MGRLKAFFNRAAEYLPWRSTDNIVAHAASESVERGASIAEKRAAAAPVRPRGAQAEPVTPHISRGETSPARPRGARAETAADPAVATAAARERVVTSPSGLKDVRNDLLAFRGANILSYQNTAELNQSIRALRSSLKGDGLIVAKVSGDALTNPTLIANNLRNGRAITEAEFDTLAGSYRTRHTKALSEAAQPVASSTTAQIADPIEALARRAGLDADTVRQMNPGERGELARAFPQQTANTAQDTRLARDVMSNSDLKLLSRNSGIPVRNLREQSMDNLDNYIQRMGRPANSAIGTPMASSRGGAVGAIIDAIPRPLKWIGTTTVGALGATALGANALSLTSAQPESWGPIGRMFVNATDGLALGGDYDQHLSRVAEFIFNRMTSDPQYLHDQIKQNLNIDLAMSTDDAGNKAISSQALSDPNTRERLVRALNSSVIPDIDLRQALGVYVAVQLGKPPETTPAQLLSELTTISQAQGANAVADAEQKAKSAAASGDVGAVTGGVSPTEQPPIASSNNLSRTWFQIARDSTPEDYQLLFAGNSPNSAALQVIFNNSTGSDGLQDNELNALKNNINSSNLPAEVKNAAPQAFGYQP